MHDLTSGPRPRSSGSVDLSPSEKLVCEWEARHDVAARGRRADSAAALCRYLTKSRLDEVRRHRDQPVQPPGSRSGRLAPRPDDFAAKHPLAASWLRWGGDPR